MSRSTKDGDGQVAPETATTPSTGFFDPTKDIAQLMGEHDRIEEWKERVKAMPWCKGDDDCQALDFIEEALAAAKELDLSIKTIVSRGKGGLVHLIQYVYRCAGKCGHETTETIAAAINEGIIRTGVSTDGMTKLRTELPELFYDRRLHCFWHQADDGVYQSVVTEAARNMLSMAGLSNQMEKDGSPSEIDRHLVGVIGEHGVDAALALAGYPTGLHRIKDLVVLVTRSFTLVEPKEDVECKKWPHILAIIDGLLGLGTPDMPKQGEYLVHKLHCDLAALKAGIRSGGLALLIAGLPDSGKTVLLSIIRKVLGGRSAIASGYLTEKTTFNAELASAEVHTIDDGNPFTDRAARRRFANLIKQSVASDEVWVHGKGKDAFALALYRRLFILTNLDSLDAMPELEESLLDKIMLLKAVPFEMPEGLTPLPPMHDVVEVEVNNLLLLLLKPETRERARQLFHGPKVLGCALAEVKRDHPKLYKRRRSHGKTYWTVVEDVEPVHDMVVATFVECLAIDCGAFIHFTVRVEVSVLLQAQPAIRYEATGPLALADILDAKERLRRRVFTPLATQMAQGLPQPEV